MTTVYGNGDLVSALTRTVESLEATTQILIETAILTNSAECYATNQPDPSWGQTGAVRHYLGILITNPTGSDKSGSITTLGGDGATPFPNELTETFYVAVPAGTALLLLSNSFPLKYLFRQQLKQPSHFEF